MGRGALDGLVPDPEAFSVVVEGDFMCPAYRAGDVVLFSPSAEVGDGDDAYVEWQNSSRKSHRRFRRV